jgi:putative tricarboxylic transport membrane protein
MSDRIFGLVVAVVALAFFASATQLEQPFFADPLGPKAFPYLISVVAFIAASMMIFSPDKESNWPNFKTLIRISVAVIILILYANSLKPFGFLFSTAVAAGALSYQIRPRSIESVAIGVGLSVVLFIIFKYGLGLGLFAFPRWL